MLVQVLCIFVVWHNLISVVMPANRRAVHRRPSAGKRRSGARRRPAATTRATRAPRGSTFGVPATPSASRNRDNAIAGFERQFLTRHVVEAQSTTPLTGTCKMYVAPYNIGANIHASHIISTTTIITRIENGQIQLFQFAVNKSMLAYFNSRCGNVRVRTFSSLNERTITPTN